MRRAGSIVVAGVLALVVAGGYARAQDPFAPPEPGSPPIPCARLLLNARATTLRHMLGLSPAQTATITALRNSYWTKRMELRLHIAEADRELRRLVVTELPDEARVLTAMHKLRELWGALAEERTKMDLRALAALTREQRAALRVHCFDLAERAEHHCTGGWCSHRTGKPIAPPRAWGWEAWASPSPWQRPDPFNSGRAFDWPFGPPPDWPGWK